MGTFGGIGIYMGFKDGNVEVMGVIPGGPSDRAGLKAGDSILAVNSQPISEIEPSDVALRIRGEIDTPVEILIGRAGEENKTYKIGTIYHIYSNKVIYSYEYKLIKDKLKEHMRKFGTLNNLIMHPIKDISLLKTI